jgi:hypothetical protein
MNSIRKLIVIPLCAALSSCSSGDVVVKSDLGEEYLVRNDAVYVQPYKKDGLAALKHSVTVKYEGFLSCASDWPVAMSREQCASLWLRDGYDADLLKMRYLESFNPKNLRLVKYRQIYTDLNGKKLPSDYLYVTCVNPGLSVAAKEEIEKNLDIKQSLDTGSVEEQLKAKICERWAKFS